MKLFLLTIISLYWFSSASSQQKTFIVNFSSTLERIKDLGGVNGGPDVLPAQGQVVGGTAIKGYKDGGVSMIRTHDVAGLQYFEYAKSFWVNKKINSAFDPTVDTSYRWIGADQKIDSIISSGFLPYFRVGISYDAAHDVYSAAPVDPDKLNFTKFAEVCKRTVMHYNKGWAKGKFLGVKYWEIWNEPDGGFWRDSINSPSGKPGDSIAFTRMYKAVTDSMKLADQTIKVGGPGVLSGSILSKRAWITTFLNECKKINAKLDFFSWHLYNALNPYAITIQGNYVRNLLDSYGFSSAESHVSEHNIRLGGDDANSSKPLMNTPKHGAFTASSMISAQLGKIDKILFYRGTSFMNLFGTDTLNGPNPTLSGQGFRAFTELTRFAPQRIAADTSEFISTEASSMKDTTNIMILAGRSDDLKSCYILISNYNSKYISCTLNINNLPWSENGTVVLKKTMMNSSGTMSEISSTMNSGTNLSISVSNITAPAFALLRFQYETSVANIAAISSPTVSNIASNSAVLGANVTSDGSSTILERGMVWSMAPNPTTSSYLGKQTSVGTTGIFTVNATGLLSNTLYHYRGYAINSIGVSYTSDASFNTTPKTPAVTTLQAPVNNSILKIDYQNPVVNLIWNPATDATKYNVQVAENINFTPLYYSINDYTLTSYKITVRNNIKYFWRVKAYNSDVSSDWSSIWSFNSNLVGIEKLSDVIPTSYAFMQNYPNPFNPETKIEYSLPENTFVSILIYDTYGREIEKLVNKNQSAGIYSITWKPDNLPSGVFYYRIQAGNYRLMKKMVYIR